MTNGVRKSSEPGDAQLGLQGVTPPALESDPESTGETDAGGGAHQLAWEGREECVG